MATLPDLTKLTHEQLVAMVQSMANGKRKNGIKVNALGTTNDAGEPCKGTISIYGIRKFPLSYYPQEVLKLLDKADEIRRVIEDNKAVLSWKA